MIDYYNDNKYLLQILPITASIGVFCKTIYVHYPIFNDIISNERNEAFIEEYLSNKEIFAACFLATVGMSFKNTTIAEPFLNYVMNPILNTFETDAYRFNATNFILDLVNKPQVDELNPLFIKPNVIFFVGSQVGFSAAGAFYEHSLMNNLGDYFLYDNLAHDLGHYLLGDAFPEFIADYLQG